MPSTQSGEEASLSPEWTKLLFTNDNDELFLRDLRSRVTRKVRVDWGGEPRWSPDGQRFVFRGAAGVRGCQLHMANADRSGQRIIPNTRFCPGDLVAWSPDGTRLAFNRGIKGWTRKSESEPRSELWTIRTDGSELRRIVPRGSQWDLAWTR